jgi:predicted nucleic-acid-binding protein
MMISVDTNILVRAILEDDLTDAITAQHLLNKLAKAKKLFISSYTILEMVWVLKVKRYNREIIKEVILDFIDSPGIVIGHRDIVVLALEKYVKGKADFGDYLILAESESSSALPLVSFDKKLCNEQVDCCHPSEFL